MNATVRSGPESLPSSDSGLTARDGLLWATRLLTASGCDSPRLDAELLLAHVMECERSDLPLLWEQPLAPHLVAHLTALLQRRASREPLAYLLKQRGFYDIDLRVTPAVLVPRPETEHLVEKALAWAAAQPQPITIADVGTGSGAIAIVLARHLVDAQVWAIDISADALSVARSNATTLGVGERITFVQADLLTNIDQAFDLIAANLPYIPRGEIPSLMPEVSQYEPRLALDGGADGLDLVRRLVAQLPKHLHVPGLALFEIDHRQAAAVVELVSQALPDARTHVIKDYARLDRVVTVERVQRR